MRFLHQGLSCLLGLALLLTSSDFSFAAAFNTSHLQRIRGESQELFRWVALAPQPEISQNVIVADSDPTGFHFRTHAGHLQLKPALPSSLPYRIIRMYSINLYLTISVGLLGALAEAATLVYAAHNGVPALLTTLFPAEGFHFGAASIMAFWTVAALMYSRLHLRLAESDLTNPYRPISTYESGVDLIKQSSVLIPYSLLAVPNLINLDVLSVSLVVLPHLLYDVSQIVRTFRRERSAANPFQSWNYPLSITIHNPEGDLKQNPLPIRFTIKGFPASDSDVSSMITMQLLTSMPSGMPSQAVRAPPLEIAPGPDPALSIRIDPTSPLKPFEAEISPLAIEIRRHFAQVRPDVPAIIEKQGYAFALVVADLLVQYVFHENHPMTIALTLREFPIRNIQSPQQVTEYMSALRQILEYVDAAAPMRVADSWLVKVGRLAGIRKYVYLKTHPENILTFRANPRKLNHAVTCIDLAAGPNFSRFMPTLDPESHYIAVDQSPLVAALLQEVAKLYGVSNVTIIRTNAWALPRPKEPIGVIRAKNVTSYIPGFETKIVEMLEWLAPGGQLLLEIDATPQRDILIDSYAAMLLDHIKKGWGFQYQPNREDGFTTVVLIKPVQNTASALDQPSLQAYIKLMKDHLASKMGQVVPPQHSVSYEFEENVVQSADSDQLKFLSDLSGATVPLVNYLLEIAESHTHDETLRILRNNYAGQTEFGSAFVQVVEKLDRLFQTEGTLFPIEIPFLLQIVYHELQTGHRYTQIFQDSDGTVLGLLVAYEASQDTIKLDKIAVDSDVRQQGIARQMLRQLAEQATRNHKTNIELLVLKTNRMAQRIYERYGFKAAIPDGMTLEELAAIPNGNAFQYIAKIQDLLRKTAPILSIVLPALVWGGMLYAATHSGSATQNLSMFGGLNILSAVVFKALTRLWPHRFRKIEKAPFPISDLLRRAA